MIIYIHKKVKMLLSYNKHEKYFNQCVYYLFVFFNYYCKDINSIIYSSYIYTFIDTYIRNIVNNSYYLNSYELFEDIKPMVEYFIDENRIIYLTDSYNGDYYSAYHHLAIDIQLKRMSNRFKLIKKEITNINTQYFNSSNINYAINTLSRYI